MNENIKYAVIRDVENEVYHIIKDSEIKRFVNLFELPGYDHTSANDYSLFNYDSGADEDMIADGVKQFGPAFKHIRYTEDGDRLLLDNLGEDPSDLEGREEEIEDFLNEWEKDKAEYCFVDAYTFWDGHRDQSIIVRNYFSDVTPAFEELTEEDAAPILKAWRELEEYVGTNVGYEEGRNGGYVFENSLWEKDWGVLVREE